MTDTTVSTTSTQDSTSTKKVRKVKRFNSVRMLEQSAKMLSKWLRDHSRSKDSEGKELEPVAISEVRATSAELREVLALRDDLVVSTTPESTTSV